MPIEKYSDLTIKQIFAAGVISLKNLVKRNPNTDPKIVGLLYETDQSANKKYVQHFIAWYKRSPKNFQKEDLPKIEIASRIFEKYSASNPSFFKSPDISKYQTSSEWVTACLKFKAKKLDKVENLTLEELLKLPGASIFDRTEPYTIVRVTNKNTLYDSCQATAWCTGYGAAGGYLKTGNFYLIYQGQELQYAFSPTGHEERLDPEFVDKANDSVNPPKILIPKLREIIKQTTDAGRLVKENDMLFLVYDKVINNQISEKELLNFVSEKYSPHNLDMENQIILESFIEYSKNHEISKRLKSVALEIVENSHEASRYLDPLFKQIAILNPIAAAKFAADVIAPRIAASSYSGKIWRDAEPIILEDHEATGIYAKALLELNGDVWDEGEQKLLEQPTWALYEYAIERVKNLKSPWIDYENHIVRDLGTADPTDLAIEIGSYIKTLGKAKTRSENLEKTLLPRIPQFYIYYANTVLKRRVKEFEPQMLERFKDGEDYFSYEVAASGHLAFYFETYAKNWKGLVDNIHIDYLRFISGVIGRVPSREPELFKEGVSPSTVTYYIRSLSIRSQNDFKEQYKNELKGRLNEHQ